MLCNYKLCCPLLATQHLKEPWGICLRRQPQTVICSGVFISQTINCFLTKKNCFNLVQLVNWTVNVCNKPPRGFCWTTIVLLCVCGQCNRRCSCSCDPWLLGLVSQRQHERVCVSINPYHMNNAPMTVLYNPDYVVHCAAPPHITLGLFCLATTRPNIV